MTVKAGQVVKVPAGWAVTQTSSTHVVFAPGTKPYEPSTRGDIGNYTVHVTWPLLRVPVAPMFYHPGGAKAVFLYAWAIGMWIWVLAAHPVLLCLVGAIDKYGPSAFITPVIVSLAHAIWYRWGYPHMTARRLRERITGFEPPFPRVLKK